MIDPFKGYSKHDKYIVRLYDGFDNVWIDVSKESSKEDAHKEWLSKTKNGTCNTSFSDIDYYAVFPSDTIMVLR